MQLFATKMVTVGVITVALNLIMTLTAGTIHSETGRELKSKSLGKGK
jgi:hypothetical protein